jgi:outer membrane lipoprotein-sorting protein
VGILASPLPISVASATSAAPAVVPAPHPPAADLAQVFRKTYSGLKSVSLTFTSNGVTGSLKAVRGKGYRISLPSREIVCDGKSVWLAQQQTRTVVINTYNPNSDEMGVDRMFFVLMNVYTPSTVSTSNSSSVVRLTPPDVSTIVGGVTQADVHLNAKKDIVAIDVMEGGLTTTWTISKLKRNVAIPTSTFSYSAPSGWKTIDLR